MLAGRKLLLADDSITIQKVVDLTFADEGVRVISVGNGREAIEKLNQIIPDVVLADVFMPEVSGYQVCEHIKNDEKLRHIPVVLLVGSFEPFDEAEARRVGADEILTKPFQSIRKLIDRVGGLISNRPPQDEVATAELPKSEPEPEKLSTAELAITTADTQPLPAELEGLATGAAVSRTPSSPEPTTNIKWDPSMNRSENGSAASTQMADELLDLGDITVEDVIGDEFVLDLEFTDADEPEDVSPAPSRRFIERQVKESRNFADVAEQPQTEETRYSPISEQFAETQEIMPSQVGEVGSFESTYEHQQPESTWQQSSQVAQPIDEAVELVSPEPVVSGTTDVNQLSPETIDAIARRVVEHMSKQVVEEIAWEVVPQLAELMIKRQLEEKKS